MAGLLWGSPPFDDTAVTTMSDPGRHDNDMTARLAVIGVRHHSPACARLVQATIERLRPAFVLIEGPADFNPHMADLRLNHQLPLAIFSFHVKGDNRQASYSPFCSYSPEWQALQSAWETGAEPLFCDLPAWHPAFGNRENRYADPHGLHAAQAEEALAAAMGEEGRDALWDALAEQSDPEQLKQRLDRYFNLLRPGGIEDPSERERETFMAAWAAWALREASDKPVVLVCGGWHAETIRRLASAAGDDKPTIQPMTPQPEEGDEAGSYLVPYDYRRLDRFTGYASGMPSPAWYERLFEHGPVDAADHTETAIAEALRKAGQVVSTADRIAWHTQAEALAMMRGHRSILRTDLLDAALATLIKDSIDTPPAWGSSGTLPAGTHPALVTMLAAMTGTRQGKLASGTRQPPLVADVEARLIAAELEPHVKPQTVAIDWTEEKDRNRARILHSLILLGIPGVDRTEGPKAAGTLPPRETFRLARHRDMQGMLIEAARWGGTLPMAATARLVAMAEQAEGNLPVLADYLSLALFAGLSSLDNELTARLGNGIAATHEIGPIGEAARNLVNLYRFGDIFGENAHESLGRLCTTVFSRIHWLIEVIGNPEEGVRAISAILACRDMIRDCPGLPVDRASFLETLGRCLVNPETAPAVAGSALGCLIACGENDSDGAAERIRLFSRPDQLGDFLSGLFALSREEIGTGTTVLKSVTDLVTGWAMDEFLIALPAMRRAFAWFPPRERERLARAILRIYGFSEARADIEAFSWMRQQQGITDQATAMALEAKVGERLKEAGLI